MKLWPALQVAQGSAGVLSLLLVLGCGGAGSGGQSTNTGSPTTQTWQLNFADSLHPQSIQVEMDPFTYSGSWGQTDAEEGLWMYSPDGSACFEMKVGGNIFHSSTGDTWASVNLGGAGCGMQTIGSVSLTSDGNFPTAVTCEGTYTLTTTSPLGTVTGSNTVNGWLVGDASAAGPVRHAPALKQHAPASAPEGSAPTSQPPAATPPL